MKDQEQNEMDKDLDEYLAKHYPLKVKKIIFLNWISPQQVLPITGKRVVVIVKLNGKTLWTTIAEYIHPKTILSEDFFDEACEGDDEYDEEKDCYWVKEGWYESNLYSENNWCITDEVMWWAEIEKPKE